MFCRSHSKRTTNGPHFGEKTNQRQMNFTDCWVKRMKSNGLGIDLKPTTLSQKQLEISQLCFNRLEANEFLKMDDDSSTATKMF